MFGVDTFNTFWVMDYIISFCTTMTTKMMTNIKRHLFLKTNLNMLLHNFHRNKVILGCHGLGHPEFGPSWLVTLNLTCITRNVSAPAFPLSHKIKKKWEEWLTDRQTDEQVQIYMPHSKSEGIKYVSFFWFVVTIWYLFQFPNVNYPNSYQVLHNSYYIYNKGYADRTVVIMTNRMF